jgi:nucleoside-triphosphatase
MKTVMLLSGEPGCGKTSAIKRVLARTARSAGGFYTEEIRFGGARRGFRIVTLDGQDAVLAETSAGGPNRVGKYGVHVDNVDALAVPAVRGAMRDCDIVVIDEIGKMEMFSANFREAVLEAVTSGKMVLGTVMMSPHPWADDVKRRAEVEVVMMTRTNRAEVVGHVLEWLGDLD